MKDKKKKMTAAISAVMSYLQEEEAAIQMQAASDQALISAATSTGYKPWGMTGRQAQMQMRNMIQLKAFHHRIR